MSAAMTSYRALHDGWTASGAGVPAIPAVVPGACTPTCSRPA
jgi:hypothetical protein